MKRKKATLAPTTYRDYASAFKVDILPHLGKILLTDITYKIAEDFLGRTEGITGKRKNNIMVPVKTLFSDAVRRGDLKENPTKMLRRFKEEKPEIDPLSFSEMKLFLANVDPHYRVYFSTAFLTGMRPNELLALKKSNVDFSMRCITVREGRVAGIE